VNWLEVAGRPLGQPRQPVMRINNVMAIRNVVRNGAGIATLPDYMMEKSSDLVRILSQAEAPSFTTYFVYPSELRNSARIGAFRDFLLEKSRDWSY